MTSQASTPVGELEVTGRALYDAWWAKDTPPVEQVRPDVWSIPVPVPDNPIRYTLCYLLAGRGEYVVVDPGWDTESAWAALTAGLTVAGIEPGEVTGVVITHAHPDHHGLSARLLSATDHAFMAMHAAERDVLPAYVYPEGSIDAGDRVWINEQGVPEAEAATFRMTDDGMRAYRSVAEPSLLLADGELLPLAGRRVRAVWTPGHTPGHLCLHDEDNDLLLTGDHVLPRISPNVGLQPHVCAPPLGPYLASLARLTGYDSAEVLPAHEWRFRGLSTRLAQLQAHHQERCAEILEVMDALGSCSSWQVTERLSWSRGWAAVRGFQRRAALAETIAHLAYLVDRGEVTGTAGPPRRYSRVIR